MTDMDKMMIEKVARAIADAFYQTSRERGLYIVYDERPFWSVVLPRAARAAISAYNPDDRLREALELFVGQAVFEPETHRASVDEFVVSKARAALSPLPQATK